VTEAQEATLASTRSYTNRQIAAALVISVKTASVHVSQILGKLDARNRSKPPRSRTGSPEREERCWGD
jgi:DNA-binding NarL/FixJ family response regulator